MVDAVGRLLATTDPYGELRGVWGTLEPGLRRVASQAVLAATRPKEAGLWLTFCSDDLLHLRSMLPVGAEVGKDLILLQAMVGLLQPEE